VSSLQNVRVVKKNEGWPFTMKFSYGLLLLLLMGCKISPENEGEAISQRVTWEGHLAFAYSVDSVKNLQENADSSLNFLEKHRHHFDFNGSDTTHLILHEFDQEYLAYAAFSKRANSIELGEGFFRDRNSLFFYHGRYLGEISYARIGLISANFLISKLVFKGEDLFLRPHEFASFPLIDQLPKSERVILADFLGKSWKGPVFTMQYRCHEDTATAFRANSQVGKFDFALIQGWTGQLDSLSKKGEIRFMGQNELNEPVVFWVHSRGIIGMVGCYDSIFSLAYVEKTRKMVILWEKP
jgi:hypothetical protein